MINRTISHYRIIEQLGVGGMGVVYKAEDTKLKRSVALKFLPPELTHDHESKTRFIREAHAASALEHDNICNIHEIDETDDGQLFIVMACYEGQTLKEKLSTPPSPPLARGDKKGVPIEEAIDIATQIGKGLQKAHEKGIIHRDIKPANIFITDDGNVKILDFGLVKLAGQAQLTKDSSTLGTIAYMSPEQLRGKEVDHRTDIWSLGVVLYEILTGELPFKGDYEQAVSYAIINEEPKPVENIQNELWEILKKLLVKNPDQRYKNIVDLLNHLISFCENFQLNKPIQKSTRNNKYKLTTITLVAVFILIATFAIVLFFPNSETETSIKSLAVLPFTNIGKDKTTNYLGFPLANQIIGDLSYLQNINVRPATSIEKYKVQPVEPMEAANELQVEYLITGRYSKEANIIRSDIELIKVSTYELIWRELIEVSFENAFQLQDIISEKVIDGLRIQFSKAERKRMQIDIPKDPLAYDYYLRSISYPLTYKGDSLAVVKLLESIQLDSSYAPAFVELGYRHIRLAQNILNVTDERIRAELYYLKALKLNGELLSGLNNLAAIYTDVGRPEEAIKLVKKALSINPNSAWTHFRLSYIYRYTGLLDKSEQEVKTALELDPGNPRFRSAGRTYQYLGRYEEARRAYDLNEGTAYHYENAGAAFLRENKRFKAKEHFNRVLEIEPESISGLSARAMLAYIEGNIEEGLYAAKRLEQADPYDAELLYSLASIYALLGDAPSSVRVLRKAVENGFFCYPFFLIDPFLNSVKDNAEFKEILAFAKQKHEAYKQIYFAEME